jgi:hypothetical protein
MPDPDEPLCALPRSRRTSGAAVSKEAKKAEFKTKFKDKESADIP